MVVGPGVPRLEALSCEEVEPRVIKIHADQVREHVPQLAHNADNFLFILYIGDHVNRYSKVIYR